MDKINNPSQSLKVAEGGEVAPPLPRCCLPSLGCLVWLIPRILPQCLELELEMRAGLYWIGLDWIGLDWIGGVGKKSSRVDSRPRSELDHPFSEVGFRDLLSIVLCFELRHSI